MGIPKHCIEFFKDKFNTYPSFIGLSFQLENLMIKKINEKSKLLWLNKTVTKDEKKENEKFLEYDSTGILIYIKDENLVTFLTTSEKIQNVELILSQLKRIKK